MIKEYASIVLWDGLDCAVEQVNNNIEILKTAKIGYVCCAFTLPDNKQHYKLNCETFVDKQNIGSFQAVKKALNYFKTNHVNCSNGLLIVYGHANLTPRTINRLFQISAITISQPSIKGFVSIRMTRGSLKDRYRQNKDGTLCSPIKATQGHEACGLILLTPKLLDTIKDCNAAQVSEFIAWSLANKTRIYGIIDGCCGDPYAP